MRFPIRSISALVWLIYAHAVCAEQTGQAPPPDRPLVLWYRKPAQRWTEASVIGNGRLGGLVWGGIGKERIDLNEDTLWSGEPTAYLNPKGRAALPQVRRLLLAGKNHEAEEMVDRDVMGHYMEAYMPLGDLEIAFPDDGPVTGYRRELDLSGAVTRTRFAWHGATYLREVFASAPGQAIILRLTCDQPGRVSFTASLDSQLHHVTASGARCLRMTGRCPAHADPHYVTNHQIIWDDAPDGKGMRFETRLAAINDGGRIDITQDALVAKDCNAVTLILVAATSYNGPDKSPSREGKDPAALCASRLFPLLQTPYPVLLAAHQQDFRSLFDRVSLNLGAQTLSTSPTDERVRNYQPGADPGLAALYYQFGRYLLISGSRPGTQPCNLQGIWNVDLVPAWSCNWTLNCNAQINYWPVETANLGECHLPLIEMTKELADAGRRTARELYDAPGWVVHHNTDIWRQTGPVSGTGRWAMFPEAAAWLCQHLWEHYAFSGDKGYLKDILPVMSEAARFYLATLVEEPTHHWLVTAPDTNFENSWRKADGDRGWIAMGPTGSMQMIRQLFLNCIAAERILGSDEAFRKSLEAALLRLPPMKVSPTTGKLQEYLEDWVGTAECQVLSSWGAICAAQITPRGTPDLAAGLRKSFDDPQWWKKGLVSSWQGAFQANAYARLGDGALSGDVLDTHLKMSVNPNLLAFFRSHTAFQIDGNLGMTAAIGEMLLQSHTVEIELLPALPPAWKEGSAKGLCARGAVTVDMEWREGALQKARLTARMDGPVVVRYRGKTITLPGKAGRTFIVTPVDFL